MQIRLAQLQDLDAIYHLQNAISAAPWTLGVLKDCFKAKYQIYVTVNKQEIIAFVLFTVILTDMHLLNIGVAKAYQGQGLATELLSKVIQEGKQYKLETLFLEVSDANGPAIRMYEKFGFNEIGFRKNYYEGPKANKDARVMALTLSIPSDWF